MVQNNVQIALELAANDCQKCSTSSVSNDPIWQLLLVPGIQRHSDLRDQQQRLQDIHPSQMHEYSDTSMIAKCLIKRLPQGDPDILYMCDHRHANHQQPH